MVQGSSGISVVVQGSSTSFSGGSRELLELLGSFRHFLWCSRGFHGVLGGYRQLHHCI